MDRRRGLLSAADRHDEPRDGGGESDACERHGAP
jgi:hypothetical protein